MATKNEDADSGYINTNVVQQLGLREDRHQELRAEHGRRDLQDIDVVNAGRALVIDAYDTAVISNTRWQDVRIENVTDTLINLNEDRPPTCSEGRPSLTRGGQEFAETVACLESGKLRS